MEAGAIYGSPWLMWARPGKRPGRFGTIIGAERLGSLSLASSAHVAASRCERCRIGHFSY